MTNGEKIKEIFPNIIKYGNILIDDTGALQKNILFDDTWWNSEYKEPTTKNDLPHCQCTDAEIAKSFIEDVKAVKDQLPCGEQMDFPSTFDEFAKDYGFKDKDEVYTNGSELIPVFRVKQWLEHISTIKNDLALIRTEGLDEEIRCTMCTNCMKSNRGCDGSCVVNKDMYKAVMDAIEKRIQPSVIPQNQVYPLCEDCHNKMDEVRRAYNNAMKQEPILNKVKQAREEIENLNLNDYGDNLYQFQAKCTEILDKLIESEDNK